MSDFKVVTAEKKPSLAMIPLRALVGAARVFAYGARKYAPGNFYEATMADGAATRYLSAALRHMQEMQEPDGTHTYASLAAIDCESELPHIDHLICGLVILRAILAKDGVLPTDPGVGLEPPLAVPVVAAPRDNPGCTDRGTASHGKSDEDCAQYNKRTGIEYGRWFCRSCRGFYGL